MIFGGDAGIKCFRYSFTGLREKCRWTLRGEKAFGHAKTGVTAEYLAGLGAIKRRR